MYSLRGLLAALGFSALVLTAGFIIAPKASAQSSAPGCFAPCDAANLYLSQLSSLESQLSNNQGRCRAQCGAIRKGCFNAVLASERCLHSSLTSVLDFDFLSCSDLQASAKADCNNGIQSQSESIASFLRGNVKCGKVACENGFQDCLQSCSSD
jgi:hypothetical protein